MVNNQKGFANIILVVVIVIIVGIVGYFVVSKTKPFAYQTSTPTPTPTQTRVPTPTPTPKDETANWKTYINSRVGYQFEYPTSGLQLNLDETIKYPSTKPGDSKTQDLVQFANRTTTYSVRTEVGVGHSTIESWIQDKNIYKAYSNLSNYNKTILGGKDAYTVKSTAVAYVLHQGNVYSISAHAGIAPASDSDPIYTHLLSTFKFTK